MRKLIYKKISLIIKIFISLAILFVLFKLVPYRDLLDVFKHSKKIYILLGFIVFLSVQLIAILRWQFLLHSLKVKVSFRDAFGTSFVGLFFNLIFPSFVAGDVFKGFSISASHGEAKKVASSVLMDRFSGAVALMFISFFSYFFGRKVFNEKEVSLCLILLCLLIGFCSLVIFSKRFFSLIVKLLGNFSFKDKLINFHEHLYFFRKNPSVFLKSIYFSLPVQLLTCVTFYITSKAFGMHMSIIYFFILVPIIMMIALIPITIAGAGTREAAAVYFFSLIGVEKSVGLGLSLLNLAFTILVGLAGGIFYVTVYNRRLQPRS
ncbi:MAG: lysylphosphatidylglycerol synthase transmembrane domain-containing protein [Candidatus Omnitrophota bacterium]